MRNPDTAALVAALETHWRKIWQNIPHRNADVVRASFEDLVTRYAQPHRHYHTLKHILHGLEEIDATWGAIKAYIIARDEGDIGDAGVPLLKALYKLFWFYHDAAYDIGSGDNEVRSAALFRRQTAAADIDTKKNEALSPIESNLDIGERFILATAHSGYEPFHYGGEVFMGVWFLDVDLAILGQPADVYDEYEADIRREYPEAVAPAALYVWRRMQILSSIASRKRPFGFEGVYATAIFRDRYEERAQENIARAVKRLQAFGADAFLGGAA